jgi:hydrogenase nickel incorporation protein HypA/HybF
LERAELIKEYKTGKARCLHCNREFAIIHIYDPCPFCAAFSKELIQGKEISIKSLITS